MGHYDECRNGYCPACGAGPGNFVDGQCQICAASKKASVQTLALQPVSFTDFEIRVMAHYGVTNLSDLVKAQAHHIDKLQAKVPRLGADGRIVFQRGG